MGAPSSDERRRRVLVERGRLVVRVVCDLCGSKQITSVERRRSGLLYQASREIALDAELAAKALQCDRGHDNPDGQKYCGDCGKRQSHSARVRAATRIHPGRNSERRRKDDDHREPERKASRHHQD